MYETNIVIIGNVLTAPEWRRTGSGVLVANFRVASTARRVDRETGRWTDGNHVRVRVNCWRKLAEGVASSVRLGDPVVVTGRLYTRDWTDAEGTMRTTYEMEAVAVGLDLARGRARFFRNRPAVGTSGVDGPEADGQVRGAAAELLTGAEVPVGYGEGVPGDEGEPEFDEIPAHQLPGYDAVAALAGLPGDAGEGPGDAPGDGSSESAEDEDAVLKMEVEAIAAEPAVSRRNRRPARQQPVAV